MATREEVLNLAAGIDVPFRDVMGAHRRDIDIFLLLEKAMAVTNVFHNLKCHLGFQTLKNQIRHNIVTASDDAVDVGCSA